MDTDFVDVNTLTTLNRTHKLGTFGGMVTDVDDIIQCYAVIFTTQKGSVVHNPNLGWNIRDYLGMPLNEVVVRMSTELMSELNWQEPRAEVISVSFDNTDFFTGKTCVTLEFTFNNETYTTEI